MTEKGFATIFGLCLILVIALIVKGIQEAEMNHAYETADFQTELDLQNAADSGIYAAAELILAKPSLLPLARDKYSSDSRRKAQKQLIKPTKKFSDKNITVEVWGERLILRRFKLNYYYSTPKEEDLEDDDKVCVLFSKAETSSDHMDGKIYRRATAYLLINEDGTIDKTIHFMNLPSSND